jgi:hypothetical protein
MDLFKNLAGSLTGRSKCCAKCTTFCCFLSEVVQKLQVLNNSNRKINTTCEVKLMGQGNPESADAIFARKSAVFIADKLSPQNKNQADELKVDWVELHEPAGYKRFNDILQKLNIPHTGFSGNLDTALDKIFSEIFL